MEHKFGWFRCCFFGATVLSVLVKNLPGHSWCWGGTHRTSRGAAAWRRPTSFVCEKRTKESDADTQTETESCGNRDLKWATLVSGAGKLSTQNKWEVNTQPQEAINCSKDQLGPSRCSWLCLLWSCLTSMSVRASRSEPRKQRAFSFHLLSNLKERVSTGGPLKSFIVLSLPPTHQVQVIREGNYILLKKLSFYRRGR